MKRLGFIGVGMMGKPMAKNLLKAGYELTVLDVNTAAVEELVGEGAVRAGNPVEVMSQCEAVITMLPGSADVEQVVLGAQGLLSAIRDEHLVIDMSTIDPMVSKRLALEIDAAGGQMIDAPVSGGEIGAINGTLTIMIGGPATVLDRCREVLAVMGNKLIHAGNEAGMGGKVKLVNNMITGISMIATSEAFLTGLKAGLSMETIVEVVGTSSGNTWVLQNHFPNTVLKNQHEPGFMLDLMYKDVGLALALADDVGVPVPVAGLARQVYQSGRAAGLGRKDFSAIWKHMAKAAGVHQLAPPHDDTEDSL